MFRLISLYAIAGPIIGSYVFVASEALYAAEFHNQSLFEIAESISFGVVVTILFGTWGLIVAFPLGIIPAVISGCVFWLALKKHTLSNLTLSKRFLLGSLTSLFVTTILCFLSYSFSEGESFSSLWRFFAWPGAIAGGTCGLFVTNKFYYSVFPEKFTNAT